MKKTDIKADYSRVLQKFLKEGLQPDEAKQLVAALLEQAWVKKLMVFSDQAILVVDMRTTQYFYVSPSVENLLGYKPEEFPDFYAIAKTMDPKELSVITKLTELALSRIASLNYSQEDLRRLRFSRNNWFIRKDGKPINVLQHSMGLAFNEQGTILLDFLMVTDITHFNNSPNHFYKVSKAEDDGMELVILHGMLEQDSITPREREIYSLLTLGKTSEEIAAQLNISRETVKTHRKNLLEKTNSENSIDLLRYGYAHGWL